jgi:hypothetical protein
VKYPIEEGRDVVAPVSDGEQHLRAVVLSLSWPRPERRDLAAAAIEALTSTRGQLGAVADTVSDPQLRSAVVGLVGSAGFVLDYWPGALAGIAPEQWTPAHTKALSTDLAQIALAGAPVLDRIRHLSAQPPAGPADESTATSSTYEGPRHRSANAAGRRESAADQARWTSVIEGFAESPARRSVAVMWATGVAALVLAAAWYLRYDLATGTQNPAARQAGGTPTATKAVMPPVARSSITPTGPAATESAPVTSIQIQLLGSSTQVPQIVADFLIDADGTGAFQLRVTWGSTGQEPAGAATRVISGATSYQFTMPIAAADLCGPVAVAAVAGTVSASTTTEAGPCPASTPPTA